MLNQWLGARHKVYVFDNYCNRSSIALARVRQLTNGNMVDGDIRDPAKLTEACVAFKPDAIAYLRD